MQLISYAFVIFWAVTFSLYYLAPARLQRYILAAASLLFYTAGLRGIPVSLFLTAVTTYGCALFLNGSLAREKEAAAQCADRESRKAVKAVFQRKRRRIQIPYFVFNIGLLAFYKYAVVSLPILDGIFGSHPGFLERVGMPLGISFYTLTAIGYVIDVGRENCCAETDFLRIFLFLAYFPSVTQGPFNRYQGMKEQFDKEHAFSYDRMLRGIQRFVWGAFKKLVIADRIGIFVDRVYGAEPASVPGSLFACATVMYMLQLYADFSGYIDMAAGVSETFDIMLPENFKRPYFARSVAEFWRRWHITLGAWFKDYVMFSFVMSGTGRKINKKCKNKWNGMGRHVVPAAGTMLVWFFTGIWHGRTAGYMLWGVWYGVIMSFSLIMEPWYKNWKSRLHIGEQSRLWALFCMARTWIIVFAADVLIRSSSLSQAGEIFLAFVTRLNIGSLLSSELTSYGLSKYELALLLAALVIWLAVSVIEERGQDVRDFMAGRPAAVRWVCYYGIVLLLLVTGIYGGSYDTAVFLYQSF